MTDLLRELNFFETLDYEGLFRLDFQVKDL